VVKDTTGSILAPGGNITQWAYGWRFTANMQDGQKVYGPLPFTPTKPASLLSNGRFFERSKPLYDNLGSGRVIDVMSFGAKNDGSDTSASSNTKAINEALKSAAANGALLVFPAGIYLVDGTLKIPVGSRLSGALWSQIMAVGKHFQDDSQPQPLAR
jgi:glucan 1,3-beta-glucosidase